MVSLLLSPQSPQDLERSPFLDILPAEERRQLRARFEQMNSVLSPLTRITTEVALKDVLDATLMSWVEIAIEVTHIILNSPARQSYIEAIMHFSPEFEAQQKLDLLGEEGAEQFVGAFESLQGLSQWTLSKLEKGEAEIQMVSMVASMIGPSSLRAQMAIGSLGLILNDIVSDWRPESIPLLCSAADAYMTETEDVFFSLSPKIDMTAGSTA